MTNPATPTAVEALQAIADPLKGPAEGKTGVALALKMLNDNREIARQALPAAQREAQLRDSLIDKLCAWEDMIVNCAGVSTNPDSLPQMLLHEIRELRLALATGGAET